MSMNLLKIKNKKEIVFAFFTFAGILMLWQILYYLPNPFLNLHLLPSPVDFMVIFVEVLRGDKSYFLNSVISLMRVGAGFLLAAVAGLFLGIISGLRENLKMVIMPVVDFIRPIPNVVWLPVLIVLLPSTTLTIIAIPFLGALPSIALSTYVGVREILGSHIIDQMRINNISGWKLIYHVILPGAFVHIRNGLNVGIGSSWMGVVLAEMTAGQNGIGYFTWIAYQSNDYNLMVVGAITIALFGFFSSKILMVITGYFYNGYFK